MAMPHVLFDHRFSRSGRQSMTNVTGDMTDEHTTYLKDSILNSGYSRSRVVSYGRVDVHQITVPEEEYGT